MLGVLQGTLWRALQGTAKWGIYDVNGKALGAILPPADGKDTSNITKNIPAGRWAEEQEVEQALVDMAFDIATS